MKKEKRKYTKRTTLEIPPDAVQDTTAPMKESFRYNDIPLLIRDDIERTLEGRKRVGLFDDSKERKERALAYWRGK